MSYVESTLIRDEKINYRTRLSLAYAFAGPVILLLLSLVMPGGVGRPLLLIALVVAIVRGIAYVTSEFAVTDKRVIIKVGVLRQRTVEMQLSKVETVAVNQGLLGRLFGYGEIVVTGTGGTKETFKGISAPLELRRAVQAATT
jgi:uncharacterized membrane protein YdbT with pleckstrin-like domain